MKWRMGIILVMLFFASIQIWAQEGKFKALFLFNFTKYIEWPPAYRQGDFVIGVYGNDNIVSHLETVASKMKVGSQSIIVRKYASVNEIGRCQILFLPQSKSTELNSIMNKLSSTNTLLVADKSGMVKQGSAISFFDDGGELKFEISKVNIEKAGLKVNSSLLVLGKPVQ
jgi:hypothetical protein